MLLSKAQHNAKDCYHGGTQPLLFKSRRVGPCLMVVVGWAFMCCGSAGWTAQRK